MWLTERLAPDFKTIADFRQHNGKAIQATCRDFVLICRRLGLFAQSVMAIDGSKFKAVNNRDRNFTFAKMKRRAEEIDKSIERYLRQLDAMDQGSAVVTEAQTTRLKEKIASLTEEVQQLQSIEIQRTEAPEQQVSLTDPDARSMTTRGTGVVGYNVQTAVDSRHHLIVAHEVTNVGSDRRQLSRMAKQARNASGVSDLHVVADRGYFTGEEILACHEAGITTYLPKPKTSPSQAKGMFPREAFRYVPERNEYRCPARERLVWRFKNVEKGLTLNCYWSSACPSCFMKSQCTTGINRRIKRWEHEEVLEAVTSRLDQTPDIMRIRRQTVEHPLAR